MKFIFCGVVFLTGFLMCGYVYGEDCTDLLSNKDWQSRMNQMIQMVEAHNYSQAIEQAKGLYPICRRSPILNYYTGMALLGKGEREQALVYFQKASDYISEIGVDPGISRRIWYARYELEHPECSQSSMLEQTRELAKLKLEKANFRSGQDMTELAKASEWKLMWTGAGIGMAGLVVAGVGAGIGMNVDNVNYVDKGGQSKSMKVSTSYMAGWGLFGAGLGMLVSGAIMTAVAGYKYTHHKDSQALSFHVGSSSAALHLEF
ncbi:MAG: hypothetical protein IJ268_14110 [Proteobacteria bacterium]|nr:hypothetical protein [Pseudomonadota bacterium]